MRILVGTDGSRAARTALDQLLASFEFSADAVVDVLAVEPEEFGAGPGADAIAHTNMEAAVRRLRSQRVTVVGDTSGGDPARTLMAVAQERPADLVVLGADHGDRTAVHPVGSSLGHVASTVALDGNASVLVAATAAPIRRVLVGCDGSPDADRALRLVAGLPFRVRPEITVVSVVDPAEASPEGTHITVESTAVARAIAEEGAAILRPIAARVDIRTPVGPVADALAVTAGEVGAELVVVGTRGLGARQRRRLGSVAAALLERMPANVLVARATSDG